MSAQQTDAFLLFNVRADSVDKLRGVGILLAGDISLGEWCEEIEGDRLKEARPLWCFLGPHGLAITCR